MINDPYIILQYNDSCQAQVLVLLKEKSQISMKDLEGLH